MQEAPLLPDTNPLTGSTKDKIINLLIHEGELPTKKIHFLLKKQYAMNITYQGVHKLVKQLLSQNVIRQDRNLYSIDKAWIENIKRFISSFENKVPDEPDTKFVKNILLRSLKEFDDYYYGLRQGLLKEMSSIPECERRIYYHLPHCYYALAYPTRETELILELKKLKARAFFISEGNTPIDRWIRDFYKDSPIDVLLDVEFEKSREIWLYPTAVYEVYYSYKFIEIFKKLYDSTKDIKQIKFNEFLRDVYELEDPIQIIENRNPSVLKTMRNFSLNLVERHNPKTSNQLIVQGCSLDLRYNLLKAEETVPRNIGIKAVKETIRKELMRRKISKLNYERIGAVKIEGVSNRNIQKNNMYAVLYTIRGLSGFFRKDNPLTWKLGRFICDNVISRTDSNGFFTSDEISAQEGNNLSYGFSAYALMRVFEKTGADKSRDLLLFFIYKEKQADVVAAEVISQLSGFLGIPPASIEKEKIKKIIKNNNSSDKR